MVVCKYFQQGNCRFGSSCRFEHSFPSKYSYQASTASTASTSVPTDQLIQQVTAEVDGAMKGNQWLLSCFAPYRGKPYFPGLVDYSMEEVRLLMYEAKTNGTLDQCVTSFNQIHQSFLQAYKILSTCPDTIKGHLETLYKGNIPNSPFSITPPDWSSHSATNNIFGGNVNNQSANPSNTSIFAKSAPSSPNVFDSNSSAISPSNLFASASNKLFASNSSPGNIFASTVNAQNIFASANQTQQSTTIFQQTNPANVFQQAVTSNNPFEEIKNTSNNIFQNSTNNIFQQAAPVNNVFQQTPPVGNVFGDDIFNKNSFGDAMESSNDPFGQRLNTTSNSSIFGSSPPDTAISAQALFQSANQTMFGSPFGTAGTNSKEVNEDDTVYSKDELLSDEDLQAYNSDVFTIGSIPVLPPTYALCFS